jgi:predicted ArsR family transcriptional regulator
MDQLDFISDPLPAQRHSRTSCEAALSISESQVERDRQAILRYLRLSYGATDAELCAALNKDGNTIRPRRGSLVKDGLVRDSGRTHTTASGRDATVWECAE